MHRYRSSGSLVTLCLCASVNPLCVSSAEAQTPLPPIVVEQQTDQAQQTQGAPAGSPPSNVEQTTAGPVDGYRALTASSATKTDTPIEQIPQSIQVVSRSVIEDQQAATVEEVLRNVSGVQGNERLSTPASDQTTIRGFGAQQWLDGITVFYAPGNRNSLVNVERIEVLKGPSGLLYGGGIGAPPGGAVNIVSKLPTDEAGGEFGVNIGSYGYIAPFFDVNQPLTKDGTVLFRMTGEYSYGESFVDVIETETYDLNPTLTLTNKKDTSLTLQGRFSRWEQPEYQGLPATGTVAGDFRIDPELFIGPADIPDSYSQVQSITATLDHRFDPVWSFNMKARYSESEFDEKAQTIVGADGFQANLPFIPGTSFWGLANANLFQELTEVTVNPNLVADFAWGPTKNKILLGADYSRVTDDGFLNSAFLLDPVDLTDPVFPTFIKPISGFDQDNLYTTIGVYAQLQSTIWDRLHLVGGVRRARVEIESKTPSFGLEEEADETKYLPRLGAVYDLTPGISLFAGYSESLQGQPGVFYSGAPKPVEADQIEGGVKLKLAEGLSGTLAIFEINRSNVPIADGFGLSLPIGEERSRGFEADLIWQPTANWRFLASYAYVDAELVEDVSDDAPAGNKLNAAPEHSGRLWVHYKFDAPQLRGWSVGAGVYLASAQFIDLENQFKSDPTVTFDAKIGYETASYEAALAVRNLTDEEYFIPYSYFGGRVQQAEGRTFLGTLKFKY